MSLLVKLKDRQSGQPVIADDDDDEFLNIINVLAGQNVGKSIRVVNSDDAFACARFDQTGVNHILECFANGSHALRVEKTGEIISIHTDIHDGLNADKLDGKHLIEIITTISKTWLYVVLPGAVESIESQPRFIVPTDGVYKLTKLYSVWAAGSDSGASNVFTIKRRNAAGTLQADVGDIDINDQGQNVLNSDNIGDVTLTAGDQIYPLYTTRNTASEQMVSITIELTVTPT